MNKKSSAIVVGLLLLMISSAWAIWWRKDPQIAKVEAIRAQLNDENLPREKRREMFQEMREEMDKLPEATRQAMWEERQKRFEAEEDKRMKDFFALTPPQQIAEVDKRIDDMQAAQKRRAARRGTQNGQAPGQRGGGPGQGGQGGQGRPGGGGGPGGRGGASSRSPAFASANPNERYKDRLDNRSADSRASRDEYRRIMQQRMTQRGITGGGGGRGWPG